MSHKIQPPYYPIVYVRGYAMTDGEREETFHDTYYGFAATSVDKRQVPPPEFLRADMFEGQLIRFMKLGKTNYFDATNRGLEDAADNPSRSLWVCRFYDEDVLKDKPRDIVDHAKELYQFIYETIPARLESCGVDLGQNRSEYKVILMAHSMGGLVCRTLIQNILPDKKLNPKDCIHRLVTMGTPHKGVEMGRMPDFVERAVLRGINPFNANIFEEKRMRDYLKLPADYEPNSLGDPKSQFAFPVKRCLCLIGSDYESYGVVRHATGTFSDGLVKQDRAYVVAGKSDANGKYSQAQKPYWANVHRAHSGRRGIVNSYESFENIHRFLFGNVKAEIYLENVRLGTKQVDGTDYYYDVEFALSIRGTPIYLHRRQQDPCENAIRYARDEMETKKLLLHTVFMNSALKMVKDDPFLHFQLQFRVRERAIKKGFLWDREYPDASIYAEDIEVRIGDFDQSGGNQVQYRWLAEGDWRPVEGSADGFRISLRKADSLTGNLLIIASKWPDEAMGDDVAKPTIEQLIAKSKSKQKKVNIKHRT